MNIAPAQVKELREKTGAGVMDCRNALLETGGDEGKAMDILRRKGLARAERWRGRAATQGLVEAYIHPGGRLGALVEVNCETDFVARTEEFKELVHDLALQVAGTAPQFLSSQEMPAGSEAEPKEVCLLLQPLIKDDSRTVEDRIKETMARLGENIVVKRFARFELGRDSKV